MIGRIITLGLCAGSFWLGMEFHGFRIAAACNAAGGSVDAREICIGVNP